MWNYVGIVRTDKRLERAARRIELIRDGDPRLLLELARERRPARAAQPGAGRRPDRRERAPPPESRGLHYTLDHPDHDQRLARDTVLARGDGPVV